MTHMTPDEYRRFLLSGTRTGKLATVRPDGRPHVVPIWFDLDGDTLVFMTGQTTIKGMNIQRDPRVCICVDDETPPFAFVQVEGRAALSADADELLYWATRIGGRYMGADQAEAYGRRNATAGELLVRVMVSKVIAQKDIAS